MYLLGPVLLDTLLTMLKYQNVQDQGYQSYPGRQ